MNPFSIFSKELLAGPWAYGEESGDGYACAIPERLLALQHPKANRLISGMLQKYGLLLPYLRSGSVADLCCGSGFGAAYLAMHGYKVTALDATEANLARSTRKRSGFKIVAGNLFKTKPTPQDAVTFVDALEHFPQALQAQALQHVRNWLKPRGILLLDTPLAPVSYRQSRAHPWVLSWDDLGSLVERAGFKIMDRFTLATYRDQIPVLLRTREQPVVYDTSDQIVIAGRRDPNG